MYDPRGRGTREGHLPRDGCRCRRKRQRNKVSAFARSIFSRKDVWKSLETCVADLKGFSLNLSLCYRPEISTFSFVLPQNFFSDILPPPGKQTDKEQMLRGRRIKLRLRRSTGGRGAEPCFRAFPVWKKMRCRDKGVFRFKNRSRGRRILPRRGRRDPGTRSAQSITPRRPLPGPSA